MAKNWEQITSELKNPFHPNDIEWRVGSTMQDKSKGLALAYITNRAIQNRLDEVLGLNNWRNEFKPWQNNGVLCGISIRLEGDTEWITKWDGSDESNMDATKGGLSGAMKRAGYQLGIGRYLYNLDASWVELKPAGKGHVIKPGCEPSLPEWALPEGFTYKGQPKKVDTQPKEVTPLKAVPPKETPANLEGFWVAALAIGYTKPMVLKEVGEISIDKWSQAKLGSLYRDLKTKSLSEKVGTN